MATIIKKIGVITASTRVVRVGPKVAEFVTKILFSQLSPVQGTAFTLHPIDIATFKLPVFDEAVIPAMVPAYASFSHDHSIAWSAEIQKYDGFVLVTGEYNTGPPGGVKNALDYLYNEVRGKPFLVVSYGVSGGGYSNDSLRKTLTTMTAKVVETRVCLPFSEKGEKVFGLSDEARGAGGGTLGPNSLKEWEAQKSEIEKGFEEVKKALVEAS